MNWFGTIFFWFIMIGYGMLILAKMFDDDEKKQGLQKRKYYSGKAGLKYTAPGDGEKRVMAIFIPILWILVIIGAIIANV